MVIIIDLISLEKPHNRNPTNTPRVFHVETTCKRPFHVISTWNTRDVFLEYWQYVILDDEKISELDVKICCQKIYILYFWK